MSFPTVNESKEAISQKYSDAGNYSRPTQNYARQRLYETSDKTAANQVFLKPALVAGILGAAAFMLVLASSAALLTNYLTGYNSLLIHKLVKLFYVELELNAPAFFSMLLLLLASLLLAVITVFKRRQTDIYMWQWTILSFGFFLMAFDEIIAVHERAIEPMRAILGEQNLGVLYFAWVIPAIALILFLAPLFLKFLLSLPAKTSLAFLIAATLYLGGAVGFELIEGSYSEIHGKENLTYIILTTVEETLEMAGVIVFIWALLVYINETYREVHLWFNDFGVSYNQPQQKFKK